MQDEAKGGQVAPGLDELVALEHPIEDQAREHVGDLGYLLGYVAS